MHRFLRPQISLRSLLVLFLIFGGWLGIETDKLHSLEAEAQRIWNYRGDVYGPDRVHYRRSGPEWLKALLPQSPLPLIDRACAVNFASPLTNDRSVQIVARHHDMAYLSLCGGEVTDVGVSYLRNHRTLRELSLRNTHITDASIATLTSLHSLEVLSLYGCRISDAGVPDLAGLSGLQKLNLENTDVSTLAKAELRTKLPACFVGDF